MLNFSLSSTAGFGSIADATAVLLPDQPTGQPLAIALIYEPSEQIDVDGLRQTLQDAIARSSYERPQQSAPVELLAGAA